MPVADPPLTRRISLWFRNLGNSSPNARNPPHAKQSIFEVLAVFCKQLDDFDRTCPGSTIKTRCASGGLAFIDRHKYYACHQVNGSNTWGLQVSSAI